MLAGAMIERDRTHPLWLLFFFVWTFGWLGVDLYWLFTESGPIGWLGRWQARTLFDGSWYPKITTLLFIVVAVFALVAVKLVIERVTGKRLTQPVTRSES